MCINTHCEVCGRRLEKNHHCPPKTIERIEREHRRERNREPMPVTEPDDFDSMMEVAELMNMEMDE